MSGGATLQFSGGITVAENITATGGGDVELNSIAGDNTLTGTLQLNTDSQITAATGSKLTVSGTISGDSDYYIHINGTRYFDNSGERIVTAGTVELSGANDFPNKVQIDSGTLLLSNDLALGNTFAGIEAILNGAVLALANGISINGEVIGTISSDSTIRSISGSNSFSGDINAVDGNVNFDIGSGSTLSFSGAIASTSGGLTKLGSSTLQLTGTNTYTGATTVSAGKLLLEGGAAIADSSAVTISSGAELELRTSNEAIGSLAGEGSLTLNGGSLTTGGNNSDTTFSRVIQDGGNGGGLTKVGTGTLTLSGNNTYAGDTAVLGGSLSVSGDSNLGSEAIILNSGTLSVTGDGANIDNAISILSNGGVVNVDTGVTATLSGIVSGTGALTKAGAGVLASGCNQHLYRSNQCYGWHVKNEYYGYKCNLRLDVEWWNAINTQW